MPRVRVFNSLTPFHTTDDLNRMWTVMRPELENRLGEKNFICLPHITDGNYYGIGSVFVKIKEVGLLCNKMKTFLPLGPIESLVDQETTKYYWNTKHPLLYSASSEMNTTQHFKISKGDTCINNKDYGFSIILQDPFGLKELKLNVDSFHFRPMPIGLNPVDTIVFNRFSNPELSRVNDIYIVTAVKEVDRLELTGTIGVRTRIYHITNRYPLFFTYSKYKINNEGRITNKLICNPSTRQTTWIRMNETENIDDVPLPDWLTFGGES